MQYVVHILKQSANASCGRDMLVSSSCSIRNGWRIRMRLYRSDQVTASQTADVETCSSKAALVAEMTRECISGKIV